MKKWLWLLLSFFVIIIDQGSKLWVLYNYLPYQSHSVLPLVNLTLAYNTGAAFSLLSSAGSWHHWFFISFSLLMSGIMVIWISRLPSKAYLNLAALSLILGGAIGNLIDRLRLGFVIDFIDVFYGQYHWPVFNLADSAICLGAILLIFELSKSSCSQEC